MAKTRKKFNPKSHRRNRVKGLIVEWKDTSPTVDSSGFILGRVSHRNHLYRLMADIYFAQHKKWIVYEQEFLWSVNIVVVFNYENETTQHEERELTAFIKLAELDEISVEQIEDAMRHGDAQYYSHTEFVVECLGTNATIAA
jgi:hypothetical protein